jgi:hypothetical protein
MSRAVGGLSRHSVAVVRLATVADAADLLALQRRLDEQSPVHDVRVGGAR